MLIIEIREIFSPWFSILIKIGSYLNSQHEITRPSSRCWFQLHVFTCHSNIKGQWTYSFGGCTWSNMAEKTTVTTNNDNPYDHVVMNIHDQFVIYTPGRCNQTNNPVFTTMSHDCRVVRSDLFHVRDLTQLPTGVHTLANTCYDIASHYHTWCLELLINRNASNMSRKQNVTYQRVIWMHQCCLRTGP